LDIATSLSPRLSIGKLRRQTFFIDLSMRHSPAHAVGLLFDLRLAPFSCNWIFHEAPIVRTIAAQQS
jgi:hypothetical protein